MKDALLPAKGEILHLRATGGAGEHGDGGGEQEIPSSIAAVALSGATSAACAASDPARHSALDDDV